MKKLLFSLLLVVACTVQTREAITNYHSDITIGKDGWLDITEKIQVYAEGRNIRKGIYRDFPLCYKSQSEFSWIKAPFWAKSVKRDGKLLSKWDREQLSRGTRIYMRDGTWLKRGPHTFEFAYKVGRQIGFFKKHDELYWNVVGGDWMFPIYAASATVHLPEGVTTDQIKYTAYAGSQGSSHQAFTTKIIDKSTIQFFCTKELRPHQAFSVVIGMPKGSIIPPSVFQKMWWSFYDYLGWIFVIMATLLFSVYGWYLYDLSQADDPKRPIIPLFEPPKDFTPGMVSYFVKRRFSSEAFAADLVNLGVHQSIGISLQKGVLSYFSKTYELELKTMPEDEPYKTTLRKLFAPSKNKIVLDRSRGEHTQKSYDYLKEEYSDKIDGYLLSGYFVRPFLVCIMVGLVGLFLSLFTHSPECFWAIGTLGIMTFFIVYHTQSYTREGFEIRDQIAGFKLYLNAAEVERLKYTSTPPERTPELYEKYLPYAMALGVEEQWSHSFSPVFKRLENAGTPYHPVWYHGGGFRTSNFSSASFANGLGSSLSSSINASAPGTRSGFGGGSGGGAGGGGGGGGGGGC